MKVIADRQLPAATFQTYKWLALVAVVYCLWAVVGGDPATVVRAMVALLISVPLYPFFIRSMEAAAKRHSAERERARTRPARRPQPSRNESPTRQKKELRYANALHEYDPHPKAKRAQSRGVVRAGRARVAHGRLVGRVRPGRGARERAAAGPAAAQGARLEVQLRRGRRWVRLCELAVHEPEARGALGRSLRQLVRRIAQARADRGLHDLEHRAVLRKVERRRRAHVRRRAEPRRRRRVVVRLGRPVRRLALGRQPRPRQGRARLHDRPRAVRARPRHAARGTAPRRAARAAATGATRARRSSGPRSAASRPATTWSRRSISTRTTCPRRTRRPSSGA